MKSASRSASRRLETCTADKATISSTCEDYLHAKARSTGLKSGRHQQRLQQFNTESTCPERGHRVTSDCRGGGTSNGRSPRERITSNRHRCGQQVERKQPTRLADEIIERLSNELLDHTKKLGLFDEIRMKLLQELESSKEFDRLRGDFVKEVSSLCSSMSSKELALPRAKLREQLNQENLRKSAYSIKKLVSSISSKHRDEIRQAYEQQATQFLASYLPPNQQATEYESGLSLITSYPFSPNKRLSPSR